MEKKDFVRNVADVGYARPFGVAYKKATQWSRFATGHLTATATANKKRDGDEIGFKKGDVVKVTATSRPFLKQFGPGLGVNRAR